MEGSFIIYHRMLPDILLIVFFAVFLGRNLSVPVPPQHGQQLSTPTIIRNKTSILSVYGENTTVEAYLKNKIYVGLCIRLTTNME